MSLVATEGSTSYAPPYSSREATVFTFPIGPLRYGKVTVWGSNGRHPIKDLQHKYVDCLYYLKEASSYPR
jgi:hypothetical protein